MVPGIKFIIDPDLKAPEGELYFLQSAMLEKIAQQKLDSYGRQIDEFVCKHPTDGRSLVMFDETSKWVDGCQVYSRIISLVPEDYFASHERLLPEDAQKKFPCTTITVSVRFREDPTYERA